MELSTVVGILVVIVVAALLLKLLGKAVSFAISVISVVAVVWLVVIGLRYLDERDIRDKFLDSDNLFVLQEDGNVITGFATGSNETPPAESVEQLSKDESGLLDKYYKVVAVSKDALPEKTALMIDAAEQGDKLKLFQSYVENSLLEGDVAGNLVAEEKEGNISVYKETLAFRHGIREVLVP
jgi:hypothetical protein